MTDNHWSYVHSDVLAAPLTELGAKHRKTRPHCPWQNVKVERFNGAMQSEWAYRQAFQTNIELSDALAQGSSTTELDDATALSMVTR